jgi:hypothetical protein
LVSLNAPAIIDHSELPDIDSAELPALYKQACLTIAECAAIDECKDWADKSAALASYAKQSSNDELYKQAVKIQMRAFARAGELLSEIQKAHGANQNIKDGGDHNVMTRTQTARDAGFSERQQKTALQAVRAEVRQQFSQFKLSAENKGPQQLTLPGFKCVQEFYPIKRGSKQIVVHIKNMSCAEIEEKRTELMAMGNGCFQHAKELGEYLALLEATA